MVKAWDLVVKEWELVVKEWDLVVKILLGLVVDNFCGSTLPKLLT